MRLLYVVTSLHSGSSMNVCFMDCTTLHPGVTKGAYPGMAKAAFPDVTKVAFLDVTKAFPGVTKTAFLRITKAAQSQHPNMNLRHYGKNISLLPSGGGWTFYTNGHRTVLLSIIIVLLCCSLSISENVAFITIVKSRLQPFIGLHNNT